MNLDTKVGDVEIKLDTSRIDDNLLEAQKLLNMQVVADSAPFVPFRQGALRNSVRYPDGVYGGIVEYDTPYAHYLYKGVVYGPNIPLKDAEGNIIGWTSPPSKSPTQRRIKYHEPGTTSEWFEEAKRRHKRRLAESCEKNGGERVMLRPEYFEGKADRILELYERLENFILRDIARRILKSGNHSHGGQVAVQAGAVGGKPG